MSAPSNAQPGRVIACQAALADYPTGAPFHPDQEYPEWAGCALSAERNAVYEAVRRCFFLAGLDRDAYGTRDWNPLGGLIQPGQTVLLKPNLVKESHPRDPQGWRYMLTHGSVIRAAADYVWKALGGQGRIILADAPQTDSSFGSMVRLLGLDRVQEHYHSQGLELELVDLRREEWVSREGVVTSRRRLPGDPRGYAAFDLGACSELAGHSGAGYYYGADYDAGEVNRHHSGGRHQYLLAGSAVQADVVFSLPKLKTHKKAGVTAALKNLVGINGDKNWLPHHTEGDPASGGDERPSMEGRQKAERRLVDAFRRLSLRLPGFGPWLHRQARRAGAHVFGDTETVVRSGNWWGNDTAWRMCLDLNKLLLYGRADGTLTPPDMPPCRRHIVLVDGIIAGQGSGPLNPDPVPAGVLLFGQHAPSVDAACAYLMGFNPERIPIVRQAFRCQHYPLAQAERGEPGDWRDVVLASDRPDWNGPLQGLPREAVYHFEPHFGWKGHIEQGPVGVEAQ
jgi:uncharacterized protein (DUF362 family)